MNGTEEAVSSRSECDMVAVAVVVAVVGGWEGIVTVGAQSRLKTHF